MAGTGLGDLFGITERIDYVCFFRCANLPVINGQMQVRAQVTALRTKVVHPNQQLPLRQRGRPFSYHRHQGGKSVDFH